MIQSKTSHVRQTLFPILAALIWGTAFVAQSVSAEYIGTFTFNCLRSLIAFLVLSLVVAISDRLSPGQRPEKNVKKQLLGGLCCGVLLTTASLLQQAGMSETSAGKAGFITALYVVLVPIFGLFLKKKVTLSIWISVGLAVIGLYLLCIKEDFTITTGDLYVCLCAFVFTFHILCVDYFVNYVDGIRLSQMQFGVMAVLSAPGMLFLERPSMAAIAPCFWPIVYVGVFSNGVAYTLQILSQKNANPTIVTLLLSLESVFSVLSGAVILHERLQGRAYLGCLLMFTAVILSQIPIPEKKATAAS